MSSSSPSQPQVIYTQPDDIYRSLRSMLQAPASNSSHLALLEPNTLYGSIAHYLSALPTEHVGDFASTVAQSGCLWATTAQGAEGAAAVFERANHISKAVARAALKRIELVVREREGSTGWRSRRRLSQWVSAIIAQVQTDVSSSALGQAALSAELAALHGLPIARLSILTGLLSGLQVSKQASSGSGNVGLNVRAHIRTVEDEWVVSFAECLDRLERIKSGEQESEAQDESKLSEWEKEFRRIEALKKARSAEERLATSRKAAEVPLFLGAQVMPMISDRKLEALPTDALLVIVSDAILAFFEDGLLLSSLHDDLKKDAEGKLELAPSTVTAKRIQSLPSAPLYQTLGPLSRVLSGALARAARGLSPTDFGALTVGTDSAQTPARPSAEVQAAPSDPKESPILPRMLAIAKKVEADWLGSELAGATGTEIAQSTQPITTQLWTIFKALLFSQTMVFDALMDAVVDMCPSPTITIPAATVTSTTQASDATDVSEPSTRSRWPPASTSNIPPAYLQITQSILSTYAHMYWVTSTFGSDGFDVYRRVFYSALDVLGRDGEACVELVERVAPDAGSSTFESNSAKRSRTTYYLDVAEQLTSVLPDEMIECKLLLICRPYLDDPQFRNTFESAHSVVLSIFANHKRCVTELAPYYTELLLKCFPTLLNADQLEHAFTTIMGAISDRDDALAWWCLSTLAEEVEKERLGQTSSLGNSTSPTDAVLEADKAGATTGLDGRSSTKPEQSSLSESTSSMPSVAELDASVANSASTFSSNATPPAPPASLLRQTHLQLVLIEQLSTINLVLFQSTLSYVRRYILAEEEGGATRNELVNKTFETISQGLDASKKEAGIRWWLDHRREFGV